MPQDRYTINMVGDVMLGRLVDQCFPQHVDCPSEAAHAASMRASRPHLRDYNHETPWGDTLPLFQSADLNLINLETAVTTHATKWPDKVFNYRMHPSNLAALLPPRIHYTSLANNHVLDFSEQGMLDTVHHLDVLGIAHAGAGKDATEAHRPAVLGLPSPSGRHLIHLWSASDHPSDWSSIAGFHLLDYTSATRQRLKTLLTNPQSDAAALKVLSIHWGPNYTWKPDADIRSLAHFLVDECGIDVVHGHSAHHVQGVETYHGSLIVYGCGDFVDDYAVVPGFRNDLGAVWRVGLVVDEGGQRLRVDGLEVFPTRIEQFQTRRLRSDEFEHGFVRDRVTLLSEGMGTVVERELGEEGQLVIKMPKTF